MKKIYNLIATAKFTPRFFILLAVTLMLLGGTITAFMQTAHPAPLKPNRPLPPRNKRTPVAKGGPAVDAPVAGNPNVITGTTYLFTNASGVALEDMSSGTTTINIPAAELDDGSSPSLSNIGFDFWYDGVRFTQFGVNANGFARLGAVPSGTGIDIWENENYFASTFNAPKLAPYYDDIWIGSNGKVHFKTVGSAPNRKLVVEWQNMQIPRAQSDGPGAGTFQMWLYETTGVIEFVYGDGIVENFNNFGYTVGLQSGAATNFASVTTAGPSVSYVTANNEQGEAIAAGTKYTFTPPVPSAPTGLNFTSITTTGMTLNWTDNSSNELGFLIYRSFDGVNYSFVTQLAAGTTSSAQTGLVAGTTYFWQVYAVSEGAFSTALGGSQATTALPTITSNAVTGNWNATSTWVGGVVPSATDNAVIANGATVTINTTTATCFNLTVGQGTSGTLQYATTPAATLTVNGNVTVAAGATFTAGSGSLATHNLRIGGSTATANAFGSLTVNGTFDMNTTAGVTTTFFGSLDGSVSGTGATCDFFAVTVNKGSSITPVLDVQRVITMNAPTGANTRLTISNGTFKLSSASTLTPYSNSQTICAATGRLWLNHASASITNNGVGTNSNAGSPTISGTLQVDHGTFGYGSGNNTMTVGGTGSLIIGGADATVNMFGAAQFNNNSTFNMTAGTFNVDPQAGNNLGGTTNIVRFGSSAGGTVNVAFSGGTLTLVDPHATSNTGRALSVFTGNADTLNFAGSAIRFGNGISATAGSVDGFDVDAFAGNAFVFFGNVIIDNPATNAATRFVKADVAASNGQPLFFTLLGNMTLTGSGGSRFNLNGHLVIFDSNVINNGTIDGTAANSRLYWQGTGTPQTYSGTGTLTPPLVQMDVDNPFGLTIDSATSGIVIASRMNLFRGTITNSNKLTIGNGGANQIDVQTGFNDLFSPGGSFDQAPNFNLGTGSYVVTYGPQQGPRTTGFEIPPSNTINGMEVDNPSGVILSNHLTVSNTLTLNVGNVTTNANTLALGAGGTSSRIEGYVIGNLRKTYTANGSLTFEVGTANGYSPVAANVTAGTFPANFTAKATQGRQPNITGTNALNRYWTLTATGVTADLTFNYLASDVVGTEAIYQIVKYDGALTNFPPTTLDTINHIATLNGVSSFSDWTLAEPGAVQQAVQFAAATYNVSEGGSSVDVVVTRSGNGAGAVSVNYTTGGGTATAGNDYTTTGGTLNWASGDTSNRTINIPVNQDSGFEGDETFNITLNTPTGIIIGTPNPATVTINDDDVAPTFSIDDVTHTEGNSGTTAYTFTVTKTGSTTAVATVNFQTQDGPATTGDNDYQPASGTLTFMPADTTKPITVLVNGDTTFEGHERFFVHLSGETNATIADANGAGTITNDETPFTYLVTTTDDTDDGVCDGTHCSLREAINSVNATGGQINFAPTVTGEIKLLTPLPALSSFYTDINGPGANTLTVKRDPGVSSMPHIFGSFSTTTLIISGLTISGGTGNEFGGGGLLVTTPVTVDINNCVFTNNAGSFGGGGAIHNFSNGTMTITGCTFTGNSATNGIGGAISSDAGGDMSIINCVVSGSSSGLGGAIARRFGGTMTVTNTTVTGNSSSSACGGIYSSNGGTLTIIISTVSNNTAPNSNGGVMNVGSILNVTDSAISGNTCGFNGGGLYNDSGIINLTRSTISGNTVTFGSGGGGGIFNFSGTLNVTNSTISGNNSALGGGIYFSFLNASQGTITSSTITSNNSSTFGGGLEVDNSGSVVTIKNTIIAGNSAGQFSKDIYGSLVSGGYNLIGINADGIITPTTGDQIGTIDSPLDALLGPLANNGGPTSTHALLTGSPAIDKGNAFGLTTDQRGSTRPFDISNIAPATGGDNSDIGAFESRTFFVLTGGNTTVPPAAAPVGVVRINVSTSTSFQGTLTANPATGVVRVTDANPAGTYVVTVKAFDNVGAVTTGTFNLIVETPSPSCVTPSFTSAANVSAGSNPCSVAVGDFNGDGNQDLAIANNTGNPATVSIRFGDGAGGFTGSTNVQVGVPGGQPPAQTGVQPNQVVIGDFNGDGKQDFATANLGVGTVSIRLGDGAGNFTGITATSEIDVGGIGSTTVALAIGDFNGDGKQDLAVANTLFTGGGVRILIGDGLGAFTVSGMVTFGSAQSVAVGDFNGDGKQDLAISGGTSVGIRLGDGLGGFSGTTNILIGANTQPRSLVIGDCNGDGKQDFLVAAPGVAGGDNRVFARLGDGLGNFSGTTVLNVGAAPFRIAIGDFDKNGKQDFVVTRSSTNTVAIWLGDGLGGFSGSMNIPTANSPVSVAIGDFNEDGTLDLAATNTSSNNASIRLGGCTPNTAPTISAQTGLTIQQGSTSPNSTIATVGDVESGAGGVSLTVVGANPSNGVRLQNVVNTNGTVTATVSATCTATNATFTLQASDGGLATNTTLSVAVTANTLPVLTYSNSTMILTGASTMINPATGPSDNGTFSVAFLNVTPATFTGSISVSPSTGIVTITNAAPEGTYTVNLRATDNCNAITNASFTLDVTNTATWNGSTSSNWNAAANWSPSFVPSTPHNVVIPASGVANEPILSAATATVNNLTVAAGRRLTLSGQDMTVNGILTLSGGVIDAGANTLTLSPTAMISRTGGQVMGNLRKQFGDAGSFTYTVGTANGYSPIDATVTAGAGALTVKAVQGPQPVVDASQSLQRYWSLNGSGITVNLTFHYLDPTDIPAGGSDANYRIIRVSEGVASIFISDCASGSPCVDPTNNTATINGVSSFSDWTIGAATQPTAVRLDAMQASRYDNGALIEWQTGYEADNLGFNIYRESAGRRELVNAEILAGSALVTDRVALLAGRRYAWWDNLSLANQDAAYWIEDLDLNGKATLHGPIKPQRISGKPPALSQADVLSRIGQSAPRTGQVLPGQPESKTIAVGTPATQAMQGELASKAAMKLSVRQTGWYRITQPELMTAGFDTTGDPRRLQLFVDGVEQPMLVIGESDGGFNVTDAMEFYGIALDTPSTDAHVYWLVAGNQPGKRVGITASQSKPGGASNFAYTTERRDRSIYFSGLLNGDAENFFGAVVTTQAVDQTLLIQHLDTKATDAATLEVALQGVTNLPTSPDHLVNVVLNGVTVGALSFDGREHKVERITINAGLLHEGSNTVTLTAAGGNSDISLVDYFRLTYAHTYTADNDALVCTAASGTAIKGSGAQTITGFTSPLIRVIDVTDPQVPVELAGQIEATGDGYGVTVAVTGARTLRAFTDAGIKRPAIELNQASSLRQAANGADLLVITRREFFASLAPLVALRQSGGLSVALVDIEDIYDEFSYGNKTVQAMKDFIGYAKTSWKKKPQYVLLGGDASYDPKNYLGFGDSDFTPTKLIDTGLMETASDDWLADFDGDGVAELAMGRLPVRTVEEAAGVVAKLIAYDQAAPAESVLLVADQNEGFDFEAASQQVGALIPASVRVEQINRGQMDGATAKARLLEAIHGGERVINYVGHGSVNQWRGNLLTNEDAREMTNKAQLPVFVMMTCLNGYFADPALDSLGEALLKAEGGGAVAVWASSGMTTPNGQAVMNREVVRQMYGSSSVTLGEAIKRAKQAVTDGDIRRTWILLGDPLTRLR